MRGLTWATGFLSFLVVWGAWAQGVQAEARAPDGVVGLRGGVALVTQDPAGGADGGAGPAAAADVLVSVADSWMLGIGFLGASVDVEGLPLGSTTVDEEVDLSTGLLLLEFHPAFGGLSPYAALGVGATRIDLGPSTVGCTSNPFLFALCAGTIDEDDVEGATVFAAKAGAGLDLFLNDHLVLNTELAWIYNSPARVRFTVAGTRSSRSLDLSRLTAFLGLRYYFDYDQ